MDRSQLTILVTGGTGHQGGASARHLLADGWRVRALVRDAEKPAARALADAGAELVVGDLMDRASLDAAVAGAYGVYGVQRGSDDEIAESTNLADAARAAGVQHFVYSSVRGADRDSDIPWVASKYRNELYLRSLDMPLTVFRPVTFMDNVLWYQKDGILAGKLTGFEPADVMHQWIAVDDVGRFVALAFFDPDRWVGQATEIAGDELTSAQRAAALSLALGVPVAYEELPPAPGMPAYTPAPADAPPPRSADIARLRESIPDLLTFPDWAIKMRAEGAW